MIDDFSELLSNFWSDYNVLLWNMDKPFSKLKGPELLKFITNTEKIVSFFEANFETTEILSDLCKSLNLWEKITPFMMITTIEDVDSYEKKLKDWEDNLIEFYEVGGRTFLTKNPANPGDDETFYFHVLRFYLPRIAKQTLEENGMGLEIFTMQGFERRNKESKNTLRRFSNNKGNVLTPNLKRLWDIFFYEQTAV